MALGIGAAEVCIKFESCEFLVLFFTSAITSGHWLVPVWSPVALADCGHRGRCGLPSRCVCLWWLLNVGATMWTWTLCQSARSQKYHVCSFLNSCGFGRCVIVWGMPMGALRQHPTQRRPGGSARVKCKLCSHQGSSQISFCGRLGFPWDLTPDIWSWDLGESCWRMTWDGVQPVHRALVCSSPPVKALQTWCWWPTRDLCWWGWQKLCARECRGAILQRGMTSHECDYFSDSYFCSWEVWEPEKGKTPWGHGTPSSFQAISQDFR